MTAHFDNRVLPALRFEMIFGLVKCDAGPLFDVPQHFFRKFGMPIQSRADCCSAKRKLA